MKQYLICGTCLKYIEYGTPKMDEFVNEHRNTSVYDATHMVMLVSDGELTPLDISGMVEVSGA